jgi:hypothetical protein
MVGSMLLEAADAYIFEAECAHTGRVEKILGVDDDWLPEKVFDAIEIQAAELRPACSHHECVGPFGSRIRGIAVAN